jgi:hypothetical protein
MMSEMVRWILRILTILSFDAGCWKRFAWVRVGLSSAYSARRVTLWELASTVS